MKVISLDRDVPETWLLGPAIQALRQGEFVVFPTDSIYAIGCAPWDRMAVGRLYKAKRMDASKRCSVLCADLKDVGYVTRAVHRDAFRFLRQHLPGPYTVLLHASRELPNNATGRRKSIGVRMPDHPVCHELAASYGQPLLVTSVPGWEPGDEVDPVAVSESMVIRPAVVLDQGPQTAEPSTVVDFTCDPPELVRLGKGPLDVL